MATVLITGAHAGIGFECAKQLASRSRCNLILAGRSIERMEPAAQQLRTSYGVKVTTLKLDTSSLGRSGRPQRSSELCSTAARGLPSRRSFAMREADTMGRQPTAPRVMN